MSYKHVTNKRWYHNSEGKTILREDPNELPEGFMPGRGPANKPAWNKGLTKNNNPSIAAIADKLKGHSFNRDLPKDKREAINKKIYDTMRKNNSFNISKIETKLHSLLLLKFDNDDILTQYNEDPRYPFKCDFYIKSLDLFIECQWAQEHGYHPFNTDDELDREKLQELKLKAAQGKPNNRYYHIIYYWTERDPLKLDYLRKNNLNFVLIYPNDVVITEYHNDKCKNLVNFWKALDLKHGVIKNQASNMEEGLTTIENNN